MTAVIDQLEIQLNSTQGLIYKDLSVCHYLRKKKKTLETAVLNVNKVGRFGKTQEMAINILNYKVKQGRTFLCRLLKETIQWMFCITSRRKQTNARVPEEPHEHAVTAKQSEAEYTVDDVHSCK